MEKMNNVRIMGMDTVVSNEDMKTGLNNNDLIIGGSGCGKTSGYVAPYIRNCDDNLIISDTKGRLYLDYGDDLRRRGYKTLLLDLTNPQRSMAFNPLEYIRFKEKTNFFEQKRIVYNEKDIVSIVNTLVSTNKEDREPFWRNSAKVVLSFLIAFTLEALSDEDHNMKSVVELFKILNEDKRLDYFKAWCDENPDSYAASKLPMFTGVIPAAITWGCIKQFVVEALDIFDSKEAEFLYYANSKNRSIKLQDLVTTKTAIFIGKTEYK